MTTETKEAVATCETCRAPIYEGEQVCTFYADVSFCVAHAVKRSDELQMLNETVRGWHSPYENRDYDEADLLQRVAELELQIAREGDGPAALVTA
ncbi:hypothetical protein [Pseudogemmobacter faecipullorum]|uniref:Uncharacterized protein n=1 Tax=Pseudogemmobacter faecipullorum TaxID=2755041 RepID=A0ABS8CRM2_9RHOB|nr:hypothetical protein [Pseudogemmobacter faecipullorum]MCB5411823.1 hypothetical protein [Pseudogemmobacter faecipullorum]